MEENSDNLDKDVSSKYHVLSKDENLFKKLFDIIIFRSICNLKACIPGAFSMPITSTVLRRILTGRYVGNLDETLALESRMSSYIDFFDNNLSINSMKGGTLDSETCNMTLSSNNSTSGIAQVIDNCENERSNQQPFYPANLNHSHNTEAHCTFPYCRKKVTNESIKSHMEVHLKPRDQHICGICEKSYLQDYALQKHKHNIHGATDRFQEQPYDAHVCGICHKSFTNSDCLRVCRSQHNGSQLL